VGYVLQLLLVIFTTGGRNYFPSTQTYWIAWIHAVALIGTALVNQLPEANKWVRFAETYLLMDYSTRFPLKMAFMSGNIGGFTKKTTVYAIVSFLSLLWVYLY